MSLRGGQLLEAVAARIVEAHLRSDGSTTVLVPSEADPLQAEGVDLVYTRGGRTVRAKVKADPYFGVDERKIADPTLAFYRRATNSYALETISHHLTRGPGWMFNSHADELLYYFLALGQTEEEIAALVDEPDDVFFSELQVERDELRILPLAPLRAWFEESHERYVPRPIAAGDHVGWHRIVPEADVEQSVRGVVIVGPIFARLIPR